MHFGIFDIDQATLDTIGAERMPLLELGVDELPDARSGETLSLSRTVGRTAVRDSTASTGSGTKFAQRLPAACAALGDCEAERIFFVFD